MDVAGRQMSVAFVALPGSDRARCDRVSAQPHSSAPCSSALARWPASPRLSITGGHPRHSDHEPYVVDPTPLLDWAGSDESGKLNNVQVLGHEPNGREKLPFNGVVENHGKLPIPVVIAVIRDCCTSFTESDGHGDGNRNGGEGLGKLSVRRLARGWLSQRQGSAGLFALPSTLGRTKEGVPTPSDADRRSRLVCKCTQDPS